MGELISQVLPEKPLLSGETYAPMMPRWATFILQLISLGFAGFSAYLLYREWSNSPWWVNGILLILCPAMFFAALHPKGWTIYSISPFFLADRQGMYFPRNDALVTYVGNHDTEEMRVKQQSWLFIPWENVSNIRTDWQWLGRDGKTWCAVFDVEEPLSECRDFMVSSSWENTQTGLESVVFYANALPTPRAVTRILNSMRGKYHSSELRRKYARAQ